MMDITKIMLGRLESVNEAHVFLKFNIEKRLKEFVFSDEVKDYSGGFDNYYELWTAKFADKFYDMSTYLRLGNVIESNFKQYYMYKKAYLNNTELYLDHNYTKGIFQRLDSSSGTNVVKLYKAQLNMDLTLMPNFAKVQEAMLNRHLYAHNSGVLDDKYIETFKSLTGINIRESPALNDYPAQDIVWFKPLSELYEMINYIKKFFSALD